MREPGKTSDNSLESSGVSSAISFGIIVSQKLRSRIFCSNSLISSSFRVFVLIFRLSYLFIFPAETSTNFSKRSPKS